MSERVPIEVTRQDRIYCLKANSDYHSELCEECRFYPICDHMTQDDLTDLTIKDLEALEQEPILERDGTLIVTTEHYGNVGRVLVQYGTNGTLFYQDQEPEIVPIAVVKFDEDKLREIVQEKVDEIKKNLIEQYLDKITADIQRLRGCSCSCSDGIIDDIEDIIDKYRAESEKT